MLRRFIAATQQDHPGPACPREIHAVTLALEDPLLEHPFSDRLPVPGQSEPNTLDLDEHPRLGALNLDLRYPSVERNDPVRTAVLADFDHGRIVAYKLHAFNPAGPQGNQ